MVRSSLVHPRSFSIVDCPLCSLTYCPQVVSFSLELIVGASVGATSSFSPSTCHGISRFVIVSSRPTRRRRWRRGYHPVEKDRAGGFARSQRRLRQGRLGATTRRRRIEDPVTTSSSPRLAGKCAGDDDRHTFFAHRPLVDPDLWRVTGAQRAHAPTRLRHRLPELRGVRHYRPVSGEPPGSEHRGSRARFARRRRRARLPRTWPGGKGCDPRRLSRSSATSSLRLYSALRPLHILRLAGRSPMERRACAS